jgi:hypothetical protein
MTFNLTSRFHLTRSGRLPGLTLLQASIAWGAGAATAAGPAASTAGAASRSDGTGPRGTATFELGSPDLPAVKDPAAAFAETFMANEFGCKGGNVSPALAQRDQGARACRDRASLLEAGRHGTLTAAGIAQARAVAGRRRYGGRHRASACGRCSARRRYARFPQVFSEDVGMTARCGASLTVSEKTSGRA